MKKFLLILTTVLLLGGMVYFLFQQETSPKVPLNKLVPPSSQFVGQIDIKNHLTEILFELMNGEETPLPINTNELKYLFAQKLMEDQGAGIQLLAPAIFYTNQNEQIDLLLSLKSIETFEKFIAQQEYLRTDFTKKEAASTDSSIHISWSEHHVRFTNSKYETMELSSSNSNLTFKNNQLLQFHYKNNAFYEPTITLNYENAQLLTSVASSSYPIPKPVEHSIFKAEPATLVDIRLNGIDDAFLNLINKNISSTDFAFLNKIKEPVQLRYAGLGTQTKEYITIEFDEENFEEKEVKKITIIEHEKIELIINCSKKEDRKMIKNELVKKMSSFFPIILEKEEFIYAGYRKDFKYITSNDVFLVEAETNLNDKNVINLINKISQKQIGLPFDKLSIHSSCSDSIIRLDCTLSSKDKNANLIDFIKSTNQLMKPEL